ncbi:DNA polymerase ligase N-terminal domain-containing protein [Amycolatopsis cihanbeyliensis]|uniref:Bifunctional non-homologous end joining protein LigD n=1 Tax=Amycolatopsis cihanbeyliensis TaxID=1128664 RepID=A0A542DKF7_AMYCI|nr:DNA polymerase ligase N-terminal domain-containing protein [Amycolatopsis cihanbeyliensis]TQJ03415.1 bifunctional non-homologous end joining protein LigD [Amycolatopsis cihanbeyliensis]
MAGLSEYRRKRHAGRTPEPMPDGDDPPAGADDLFVVQQHHASSLHWDLRLERDGVLVSWAVPKGVPPEPDQPRLAVHTEDHPLEYAGFEGEIPAGEYGAGRMWIWDRGRYETLHWNPHKVEVVLHGERVSGRYALINQHEPERPQDWVLRRLDPAEPGRAGLPEFLPPMPARAGRLPRGPGWAYEFRWDGMRAQVRSEGGRPTVRDRTGAEVTPWFPELRGLGEQLGSTEALLDGELVAFHGGRPSAEGLRRRLAANTSGGRRPDRTARRIPVVYLPFDLLHLDGRSCLELPYTERRTLLTDLGLTGAHWRVPEHYTGDGEAVLAASAGNGLPGVVAKRAGARYRPGRANRDWIAVDAGNLTGEVVADA